MKYLYLHCGHGRTGSTALQRLLKKNIKNMAKENVIYPSYNGFSKQILTSGNYELFKKFDFGAVQEGQAVFFSRETMWQEFLHPDFIAKLENCEELGFRIRVLAIERDLLSFADSWLNQKTKTSSIPQINKNDQKYAYVSRFKQEFQQFKEVVLARGWAKKIYSYDDWTANPDEVFFDAFGFHLPGPLTQANQSASSFQTCLVEWLDTRLGEGERKRSKWEQRALKVPVQPQVDEEALARREIDFLIRIADLQGTEIPDLDSLSQSRVDRSIRELNDVNRVDILAVRLIEECIVRSNLETAVCLIEIIRWQAGSAQMLFEMLDEQSYYEPYERIHNIASLDKESFFAYVWFGIAYMRIKKDYSKALRYLEKAIRIQKTSRLAAAIYNCYYLLRDANNLELAYQDYNDLIQDETSRLFWRARLADVQNEPALAKNIIANLQISGVKRTHIKNWISSYEKRQKKTEKLKVFLRSVLKP